MTKADLVEEVSRVTELTRKDSEVIVDTLFESVIKALKGGDKLEVRGFGSFRVRQRNARLAESSWFFSESCRPWFSGTRLFPLAGSGSTRS